MKKLRTDIGWSQALRSFDWYKDILVSCQKILNKAKIPETPPLLENDIFLLDFTCSPISILWLVITESLSVTTICAYARQCTGCFAG